MKEKIISAVIYILASVMGIFAYIYPLLDSPGHFFGMNTRSNDLPLMMAFLLALCILVLIYEIQEIRLSTKIVALLGVLIAINATLRFIELALPIFGGFSPVFFLIIITGYIFGGRVGFLMGALTILVSGLITGGIGPWLPNQMFTAGWVGMSATFIHRITVKLQLENRPAEIWILVVFAAFWGFMYGAITNLWFWPFLAGPGNQAFVAGSGFVTSLKYYGIYYLATSLVWDTGRAIGNVLLVLLFGTATLKVLRRFQSRFHFTVKDTAEGKV